MLAIIVVTARWMVRRFGLSKASDRLWVGVLGLALVVLFEIAVVLKLRGLTLTGYLSTRDPVSGTVYYLSLLIFAVIPTLFRPETAQDS